MTVRTDMQPHISFLRQHGNAALDEDFNGVTYWSDQQLQDVLDNTARWGIVRLDVGNIRTKTIWTLRQPRHYWFDPSSMDVIDQSEDAVSTTYTYVEQEGELTFDSALASTSANPFTSTTTNVYYVNGKVINLYDALADLWLQKAAQREDYVTFKAGMNKINVEEEWKHCMKMHTMYRQKTVRRWRRT